jgi:GDP-L-fucose synthase
MQRDSRIYVAGHRGLVGSALVRRLKEGGYTSILTRTHTELDLANQAAVENFFRTEAPEYVLIAAAKVGGIKANSTYPADFIYVNLAIETNLIHAAYRHGVEKLLFLGSSCIYPRLAPQPMKEEHLLTGPLEATNEPYAIAKIAGIKMCAAYNRQYGTNFLSVMPTNLYGLGDNYDLNNSHVIPALIRKIHEAKCHMQPAVDIWGSGSARREFLHNADLADACVHLMEHCQACDLGDFVNIGSGDEITIRKLAELISEIVGYTGKLHFDTSMPNALGWRAQIPLRDGLVRTYRDYLEHNLPQ